MKLPKLDVYLTGSLVTWKLDERFQEHAAPDHRYGGITIVPPLLTFHHHNAVSHSSIDVFAASRELNLSNVLQYCTLNTPIYLSCHDPI